MGGGWVVRTLTLPSDEGDDSEGDDALPGDGEYMPIKCHHVTDSNHAVAEGLAHQSDVSEIDDATETDGWMSGLTSGTPTLRRGSESDNSEGDDALPGDGEYMAIKCHHVPNSNHTVAAGLAHQSDVSDSDDDAKLIMAGGWVVRTLTLPSDKGDDSEGDDALPGDGEYMPIKCRHVPNSYHAVAEGLAHQSDVSDSDDDTELIMGGGWVVRTLTLPSDEGDDSEGDDALPGDGDYTPINWHVPNSNHAVAEGLARKSAVSDSDDDTELIMGGGWVVRTLTLPSDEGDDSEGDNALPGDGEYMPIKCHHMPHSNHAVAEGLAHQSDMSDSDDATETGGWMGGWISGTPTLRRGSESDNSDESDEALPGDGEYMPLKCHVPDGNAPVKSDVPVSNNDLRGGWTPHTCTFSDYSNDDDTVETVDAVVRGAADSDSDHSGFWSAHSHADESDNELLANDHAQGSVVHDARNAVVKSGGGEGDPFGYTPLASNTEDAHWKRGSVWELLDMAKVKFGANVAIIEGEQSWSYACLHRAACRLSAVLVSSAGITGPTTLLRSCWSLHVISHYCIQ
jgi:hypothetical protein